MLNTSATDVTSATDESTNLGKLEVALPSRRSLRLSRKPSTAAPVRMMTTAPAPAPVRVPTPLTVPIQSPALVPAATPTFSTKKPINSFTLQPLMDVPTDFETSLIHKKELEH